MSKKIDSYYIDKFGNFRGVLHVLSSFSAPAKDVVYNPTLGAKGQLVVTQPNGEKVYFDVGDPYWPQETDLIHKLEDK